MLLIDGDIIAYRTALSSVAEDIDDLYRIADSYIDNVRMNADPRVDGFQVYLSGDTNFRDEVAVTHPYKGNRERERPECLDAVRGYLCMRYDAYVSDGQEADDDIAIAATRMGASAVICTIDKDLDQVPGWHYNFVKQQRYCIGTKEAVLNFYMQLLTGDSVDNIKGIYGIGPKKALKHLQGLDEVQMYQKCLELYEGDDARVLENARLLWLRRYEGQMWVPPVANNGDDDL